MKIVCGSCGAKYSIADEKVQGKVFKIRCKKCSNVIVVKGNQDEQAAQEEAAGADDFGGAYGGTAGASEWYVVIDGDQVGPITPEEVEAYAASGRISGETYAWREGLDDWASLASLDAFAHLADSGGMPAEEKTVVADQGFGDQEEEPAPAQADHGIPDEDATTVMPADDFRSQIEEKESQVAAQEDMGGYDDQGGFGAADSESGFGEQDDYGSGAYASGGSNAAAFEESSYGDQGGGFAEESYGSQAGSMDEDAFGDEGGYDEGGYDEGGGGFDSFEDEQNYGDSGDYAGDYADDAGGGDAGGMFSAFDSADEPDDGGYGGFDDSGFDDSADTGGSQAGGGDGGQQDANDLFASRNENSVLFSLSSLDQVDAVGDEGGGGGGGGMPGGMGAMAGGGGAGGGGGQDSTTEGSGLIDIQSLASAHSSMSGGEAAAGGGGPSGPASGPDDPFGAGTMSMPALMPMGSKKSNKGLYIGLAIAGVLLLGGIAAAAYVFLTQDDKPQEKVVIKEVIKEAAPSDPEADKEKEKEQQAADEAEQAIKEGEKSADEEGDEEEGKDEEKQEVAKKDDDSDRSGSSTASKPKPKPKSKPKPKPTPKKDDDIDSIIGSVGSGGDKKEESSGGGSSADSDLPKKLSRSMVRNTIRKYNGRVHNCGKSSNKNNLSGRMMVRITVQPSGRVSNAGVTTSKFKGTDVGKCVAGVARSMKFPATQDDLTINYPFTIR
ncbi:MAG: AgmX/PglI C-terminal domain-containing protein [Myxococcota bacterium]